MTHDLEDLLAAAKNRDKALIGLPPGPDDEDANAVFIIGTTAQFEANPVKFDRILPVGKVMNIEPTIQTVGVVDDQIVIKIEVPDEDPSTLDKVTDAAILGIGIGTWGLFRSFEDVTKNQVIIELQKIRLERAKKVSKAFGTGPTKRFEATIQTARIGRSIIKRTEKVAKITRKARTIRFISTRTGARVLFKGIFFLTIAIDILLVTHRGVKGSQAEGLAGGIGGVAGGVFDVVTLGLGERQADFVEVKTTSATRVFLERIGGAFRPRVA